MSVFSISLKERRIIEDNKQFARLIEKTQVNVPQNGRHEVIKNRATHSYEVATSSLTVASSIADKLGLNVFDIDYQCALYNVSLLHDLGHPPFGHDGATLLDDKFKQLGLAEGFSDNNNNLTVIEKNNITVRNYVVASIIKYPHKLYDEQKVKYLPLLNIALKEDAAHFANKGINLVAQTKTMACQIMDEADRNSYTFSDMTDYLCMGNKLNEKDVIRTAQKFNISASDPTLKEFIRVAQSGDKSLIKSTLSEYKEQANQNYTITPNGLEIIDHKLELFRELVNQLTMEFYIKPIRVLPFHQHNLDKLNFVLDKMLSGEFLPSRHYKNIIDHTDCQITKLKAVRDMLSENSDWYVLGAYNELVMEHATKHKRKSFDEILLTAKEFTKPKPNQHVPQTTTHDNYNDNSLSLK